MPVSHRCLLCARLPSLFWEQTFFLEPTLATSFLPCLGLDTLPHLQLALEMSGRESRSLVHRTELDQSGIKLDLMQIYSKLYLVFWNIFYHCLYHQNLEGYVCSLHLCLNFCPANQFICTIFLVSTYMR